MSEDSNMVNKLQTFAGDALQQKLFEAMKQATQGIAVLMEFNGETHAATLNGHEENGAVEIGCLMKLITAMLAAMAQAEGLVNLDSMATEYFTDSSEQDLRAVLNGIRVHQLLTHSHGLDHAAVKVLPRTSNGRIDAARIGEQLRQAQTIAPIGSVFDYNHLGPQLVAAILERQYDQSFGELLQRRLLQPLGIAKDFDYIKLCPGIGTGLLLSANELHKIARLYFQHDERFPGLLPQLRRFSDNFPMSIPDWPPIGEHAVPAGIDFGGNIGQMGHGAESAAVLRIFPQARGVLVITAKHKNLAGLTLATMFKGILSSFDPLKPPKLLSVQQWASVDSRCYCGTFENALYSIVVDVSGNGSLRVNVFRKHSDSEKVDTEPHLKRYLRPALNHVFMPIQPEPNIIPALHFFKPDENSHFGFLRVPKYVLYRKENRANDKHVRQAIGG